MNTERKPLASPHWQKLHRTLWGNPDAWIEQPHGSNAETLNLQHHYASFLRNVFKMQHTERVFIRDKYREVLHYIEDRSNNPFDAYGLIVCGEDAIAFLVYTLVQLLGKRQLTALDLGGKSVLLFSESGVHEVPSDFPINKADDGRILFGLTNPVHKDHRPPDALLYTPDCYIVQTHYPGEGQWYRWIQEYWANKAVLPSWSEEELEILGTMRIDVPESAIIDDAPHLNDEASETEYLEELTCLTPIPDAR